MSENGGNIIDKILRRNRNSREVSPKTIPDKEVEEKARETVMLFVNSEKQEPLVSYEANGITTFDLNKQKSDPGTIIRIDFKMEGFQEYSFFVISVDRKQEPHIYGLHYGEGGVLGVPHGEFRSKRPFLEEFVPDSKEFLVEDIYTNLPGLHFFDVEKEDVLVNKIDVMSGGLTDRKKQTVKFKEEETSLIPGFIPQPKAI